MKSSNGWFSTYNGYTFLEHVEKEEVICKSTLRIPVFDTSKEELPSILTDTIYSVTMERLNQDRLTLKRKQQMMKAKRCLLRTQRLMLLEQGKYLAVKKNP